MTPLQILLLVVLLAVVILASYIRRVYSEFGKILSREEQENIDAWETLIEPHLGLSRDHAALCAAVLQQLTLGLIALEFRCVSLYSPRTPRPAQRGRVRPGHSRRGAGRRLRLPAHPLVALQPHPRRLGGAAPLAHPPVALAGYAHYRLHPFLLLSRLRWPKHLPALKKKPLSMSRR